MATDRPAARPQSTCFACGQANPRGLRLCFTALDDNSVCAEWRVEPGFEGFEGIVHGGVVSTMLDEAMAKAVTRRGWRALTAELRVRLRRPVATGEAVCIRGWVVERRKRRILTEASVTGADGQESAHAWASFVSVE